MNNPKKYQLRATEDLNYNSENFGKIYYVLGIFNKKGNSILEEKITGESIQDLTQKVHNHYVIHSDGTDTIETIVAPFIDEKQVLNIPLNAEQLKEFYRYFGIFSHEAVARLMGY